jgi:hypothetical protein
MLAFGQCLHYHNASISGKEGFMERDESKAKGGYARAEKLTPEERQEIARRAAEARWSADAPQATHEGVLNLGNTEIPCYVLEDGERVISTRGVMKALGRRWRGRKYSGTELPVFLEAKNLKRFIGEELAAVLSVIEFRTPRGARAEGFKAKLLPLLCETYLKARDDDALTTAQASVARKADILMRGLAHVGIIALVDEATGYQYDRVRHALEEILEQFIAKELLKWAKMFPDEFYEQMFRLKGWKFNQISTKRPVMAGKLTNNLVYERLAPGVLDELKKITPRDSKGRLKHKYFQRLTEDVGHPRLREHLASVITLMRAFGDWDSFYQALQRALPKQIKMPLFDIDWNQPTPEIDQENQEQTDG